MIRFALIYCLSLVGFIGTSFAQVPNLGQTYEFGRQNGQIADNAISLTAPDGVVKHKKTKAASFTYTPSTSRTKANLQNFVNKSRAVDPAGAAQLEQLFAAENVIQSIGSGMRGVGLDKNNVADAFALYWVNAWSAAYADFRSTSSTTAKAVARQAAVGLSQSPEFARASNAQKQEMAEALMIQGALIESAMQASKNDPAALRKLGQAVMKDAKATGLDLDKMTLTEKGFVRSI